MVVTRSGGWMVAGPARAVVLLGVALLVAGCGGGSPEKYLELGKAHLAESQKEKAIAAYSKAIQVDPDCRNAYLGRAMCYNETGRPEKAIEDFSKVIELDPRGAAYAYDQRAIIYRSVFHDEAKANADKEKAEAIRGKRWDELPQSRKRQR